MKTYRYYSTQRPVDIGTFPPSAQVVEIHNYAYRQQVEEIGRKAWGWFEVAEPIDPEEAERYELVMEA